MKQSDSIANICAALAKAQGEFESVSKDSLNPHFKAKFVSLYAIAEAVRPILAKHQLAVIQGGAEPAMTENGKVSAIVLETRIVHASGEWLESALTIPLSKDDAQGVGSAITYARRYSLSAVLGITADDDDDGNAASARKPEAKPAAREPAKAAPPKPVAVPTTAAEAREFVQPFGQSKGMKLKDIPLDKLRGALEWATEQGKYADFQAAAHLVLGDFGALSPALAGTDSDDLPF